MQRIARSSSAFAAIRQLSTKAAAPVNHAPPIKLFGIAGRYAGATYTAASKDGILEKVEAEMGAFSAVLKKSTQFANFIENPTVPREQKVAQLSALLSEDKFSHITRNLFITLSANGRGDEALKVIELFEDLIRANRGVVKVVIVSAEPLSKKIVASLQAPIMALAGENKTIELVTKVDETILGGLQIQVGDRFLDLSISNRIADLTKSLN